MPTATNTRGDHEEKRAKTLPSDTNNGQNVVCFLKLLCDGPSATPKNLWSFAKGFQGAPASDAAVGPRHLISMWQTGHADALIQGHCLRVPRLVGRRTAAVKQCQGCQ